MYLSIKPFNKSGIDHNVVHLDVVYDKRATGPVLTMQTGNLEEANGTGFTGFKMAIFSSPSGRLVLETGWKTNNKKRMGAARDMVEHQIGRKEGPAYEAIVELLTKAGSGLLEPVAV
jgi:hypothetical protein